MATASGDRSAATGGTMSPSMVAGNAAVAATGSSTFVFGPPVITGTGASLFQPSSPSTIEAYSAYE